MDAPERERISTVSHSYGAVLCAGSRAGPSDIRGRSGGLGHQHFVGWGWAAAGRRNGQAGGIIYAAKCASCHGEKGAGNPNEPVSDVSAGPLVGGHGTLAGNRGVSYWPYATIVFDYVRRAMPWGAPKSLTDQEVYSLTAYLLHLNGIISEADVINAQTLPKVQMPNRDNFITIYPREP
jgi:S-disulfanyl-L-cysteine oxidoreductase SoxD